jgi:hypothetical protein
MEYFNRSSVTNNTGLQFKITQSFAVVFFAEYAIIRSGEAAN